jgi:hypothetical protein
MLIVIGFFSCKKAENNLEVKAETKKEFTKEDFKRIKVEVNLALQAINFSSQKVGKTYPANKLMKLESVKKMSGFNDCGSELAGLYQSTCFNGYVGEFMISQNYNTNHPIVHNSFSSDLDFSISQIISGNTSSSTETERNLLVESGVTNDAHSTLSILEHEQQALAYQVQNDASKPLAQMESEMIAKVEEQENKILDDKGLSYENKEYILTTLEIQKQSKDRYMIEMEHRFESDVQSMSLGLKSKKKSFFGKLWRGLAFVAITVASAGKLTALAAKLAFMKAGKVALFTKAVSASYKALGYALAWVPTGSLLLETEAWNKDPWGNGSWKEWVDFGIKFLSIGGISV